MKGKLQAERRGCEYLSFGHSGLFQNPDGSGGWRNAEEQRREQTWGNGPAAQRGDIEVGIVCVQKHSCPLPSSLRETMSPQVAGQMFLRGLVWHLWGKPGHPSKSGAGFALRGICSVRAGTDGLGLLLVN